MIAELRPMTEADLPAVMVLERALYPDDAWTEGMLRDELAEQPATRFYLVAEESGQVVGYAGLCSVGDEADVQTIGVRADREGRGIGSALLTALLDEAVVRGCVVVYLEVRADNERAQKLYERFGFEPIGIRRKYYQPSGVDAVVMRLQGFTDGR